MIAKLTTPEHLAEMLAHHPRQLFMLLADDAARWSRMRLALRSVGANFGAVADPRNGQVWLVTDAEVLAKLSTHALPLSAAEAARHALTLALACGMEEWELSSGWTATVRRMDSLLG